MAVARPVTLRKEWRSIDAATKVEDVMLSWEKTPYMALKSRKGRRGGVDCIRFVCGAADELYGYTRGDPITLPPDQALHDRDGAIKAMHALCRRYAPLEDVTADPYLEPGDIFVVGPTGGGPGHAMIVGGIRGHVWECVPSDGVRLGGMPLIGGDMELFRIYRVGDKHKWL